MHDMSACILILINSFDGHGSENRNGNHYCVCGVCVHACVRACVCEHAYGG